MSELKKLQNLNVTKYGLLKFTKKIQNSDIILPLQIEENEFESNIDSAVETPVTQGEFNSLTSFTYNVGPQAFKNSTLLKKLNSNDRTGAAKEFERWNKGNGKVLNGLVRRRNAERKMFLGK